MTTFQYGTSALADSACRAVGGFIGKTKTLKDIGYATYSKLSDICALLCTIQQECEMLRGISKQYLLFRCPQVCAYAGYNWTGNPGEVRWKACMVRLLELTVGYASCQQKFFNGISPYVAWDSEISDLFQQSDFKHLYEN